MGSTVTVIGNAEPGQPPAVDVAVTKYWTVPELALLGLVSTWLIEGPEPPVAPVIPPVIALTVHTNEDGVLAVNVRFVFDPEQILIAALLVTTGPGLTVTVMVKLSPRHPPDAEVGVTI